MKKLSCSPSFDVEALYESHESQLFWRRCLFSQRSLARCTISSLGVGRSLSRLSAAELFPSQSWPLLRVPPCSPAASPSTCSSSTPADPVPSGGRPPTTRTTTSTAPTMTRWVNWTQDQLAYKLKVIRGHKELFPFKNIIYSLQNRKSLSHCIVEIGYQLYAERFLQYRNKRETA